MNTKRLPYAEKALGQHFLTNPSIINKICHDFVQEAGAIIEIGPGPGILSQHLVKHNRPFLVVEKDRRMQDYLAQYLAPENIFFADALHFELEEKLQHLPQPIWLVSNLPYNISVPLMIKFSKITDIKFMTLMFQREVAQKILPSLLSDKKAKNGMNSLHALCSNFFDMSLLCRVSPGSFMPPPKVESAVLSLRRKESPTISMAEFKDYEAFLRILFSEKRKQVQKILKSHFDPLLVQDTLSKLAISGSLRSETFNLEQVQLLYQALCKHS